MSKIKCPYCGLSDGNDDTVSTEDFYHEGLDLICRQWRECDICHSTYLVEQHYKLIYENLEIG